MSSNKNYLDLKSRNTFSRSVSSCRQIDGVYRKQKIIETTTIVETQTTEAELETSSLNDHKRNFLKIAGVAGLGLAATTLFPKSAEAYVAGSTPTSNVVGSKDASNTRINPAKEDGNLATLVTNTTPLVTGTAGGYVRQDSTGTIAKETGGNLATIAGKDFATQTTLAGMKSQTDKLTFDGSNNLLTASSGGASIVGLKDTTNTQMNPATDDAIVYLRRMVKLMESQAVVDQYNRQRVAISEVYGTGASVALQTPRVTVANDSSIILAAGAAAVGTVGVTSISTGTNTIGDVTTGGYDRRQFMDIARNTYANGIRQNLIFS